MNSTDRSGKRKKDVIDFVNKLENEAHPGL